MSYLNHDQIQTIVSCGLMENVDPSCINTASLDVRLGDEILVEECRQTSLPVDYRKRERLNMRSIKLDPEKGYVLRPGEVMLAHTMEKCNFSDDLAALFRIKSSMGRIFLEHMDAGWVDPGYNGTLTLEFKNMAVHHSILLRPGDRIGQLVFFQGEAVRNEQSYRVIGNYNGNASVAQVGYKEGV